MYQLSIESPEWGHVIYTFKKKKEALKEASYVRRHGCFFSDDEPRINLEKCEVVVVDVHNSKWIYHKPFTGKYLSHRG